MAMGWIGGVIGGNFACYHNGEAIRQGKHLPQSDELFYVIRNIENELFENGCKTIEEKRNYLLKISMITIKDIPYRDLAIRILLDKANIELEKEQEEKSVMNFRTFI